MAKVAMKVKRYHCFFVAIIFYISYLQEMCCFFFWEIVLRNTPYLSRDCGLIAAWRKEEKGRGRRGRDRIAAMSGPVVLASPVRFRMRNLFPVVAVGMPSHFLHTFSSQFFLCFPKMIFRILFFSFLICASVEITAFVSDLK